MNASLQQYIEEVGSHLKKLPPAEREQVKIGSFAAALFAVRRSKSAGEKGIIVP